MKITGRNLKHRLYGLSQLPFRMARARYFRGHGIHSPFVYNMVRKVFMRRTFLDSRRELYNALIAADVPRGRAMQLQNLVAYCNYGQFGIDTLDNAAQLVICTRRFPTARLHEAYEVCRSHDATLCIMSPYYLRDRQNVCRALTEHHASTVVDNRGYLLIFNNRLPKQHFRL